MKYLKHYKLFEEQEQNLDIILSTIVVQDPEKIFDYIGLDKNMYEIADTYYDRSFPTNKMYNDSELGILISSSNLERLLGVEDGIIGYIQQIAYSYSSGYEYYVDDDELNYIGNYLSGNTLKEVAKLGKLFGYKINPEKVGKIKDLFEYLGLKNELEDFKNEISYENERAVEKAAKEVINALPFSIDSSRDSKKDLEVVFNYQEVIDYIKKNNLQVKTIKEFIENVDSSDISYDLEYSEIKQEYIGDFADLNRSVYNVCSNFIDEPDEIFPKLIESDNLELIQSKLEFANFFFGYDMWVNYNKVRLNLFDIAVNSKNRVLDWFKSYDFQKTFIENDKFNANFSSNRTDRYKMLINSKIINSDIESEYEYLVYSEKYNL